jgi:hypothetical protein
MKDILKGGCKVALGITLFVLACEAVSAACARKLKTTEPLCDGELPDMECIEADGFITCYMSGPVQPI